MTAADPASAPVHMPAARASGLVRPTIAIINATTVLEDSDFAKYVPAQQRQLDYDFAPLWGKSAHLVFVGKGGTPPKDAWQLVFTDNADQAGALGYHDTTSDGHPLGKVFVKTTMTYGGIWTVTGSHECLELNGDPDIVRCVFLQTSGSVGTIYAYEASDAVEADELGYEIDGVWLSDFVTQEWFDPGHYATAAGYSFKKRVTSPLSLAPGGYIAYFKVGRGSGWQQHTADQHGSPSLAQYADWQGSPPKPHQIASPGGRRERRARGRDHWLRSTAHGEPERTPAGAAGP